MYQDDQRSLFQTVLEFFTKKQPAQSTSFRSRKQDVWLRTDAYLQLEFGGVSDIHPGHLAKPLRAFEDYLQFASDEESDCQEAADNLHYDGPYTKLQALRRRIERSKNASHPNAGTAIRVSKRRREGEAVLDGISQVDRVVKRHRGLPREEPEAVDNLEDPDADLAMPMRRDLANLDDAVRLALPQQRRDIKAGACYEVFFGMRSPLAPTMQEAKITIKDVLTNRARSSSKPVISSASDFVHICQSITESLGQRHCLHLALEDGVFQRLRPQPKAFGGDQLSRSVSLSALFQRQQELRGAATVLPLRGKRVLAVTLASALLPHYRMGGSPTSRSLFWPLRITVLTLGILLCELHYCTPVEQWQRDDDTARNVNSDYYTSLDMLKSLDADAGVDYYLAAKACLQWEYLPPGQPADFDSVSVQRRFYQNVVKRLENDLFKQRQFLLEDLKSFDTIRNESCWGRIVSHRSLSDPTPVTYTSLNPNVMLQTPVNPFLKPHQHGLLAESSEKSFHFFDASHQTGCEQDNPLSQKWMDNLVSSIYRHVDPYETVEAGHTMFEPVRIAILNSGFDPDNPLLMTEDNRLDPRIKDARSFVHQTEPHDVRDEIGHGTHALGLLLKVATCAEIYIAKIAHQEKLTRDSFNDITKAINYAVSEWKVDIVTMPFGIREHNEPMTAAVVNALYCGKTLMFAAVSNDRENLGRAFPAKYPGVFCIHSTDGNGNPSAFSPTAHERDVDFSLLGENVSSHWPFGKKGHHQHVKAMSGTSVATPIAAGLAATVLSFVRQQEQRMVPGK
ncbi:hypothetical protein LCI18_009084 [Fusarium solani-melongenae]|uniref:Uncharacterized protein n=1 Tax=Fusarium solani subsp. cucurbitae TaxID=2747967 RepID=A0ACD3ZA91_FUSSC|nr:hypothetical protein LCI18_009084 [Fusarium solani-melongenae]